MKKILVFGLSVFFGTAMVASSALFAHADNMGATLTNHTRVGVEGSGTSASVRGDSHVHVAASGTREGSKRSVSDVIARGDAAIDARIDHLKKLEARIEGMKRISADDKATFEAEIESSISSLTSLKVKIDADTDVKTTVEDARSIATAYRIYALLMPKGYITVAADRINTIADMMTTLSAKLETRINEEKTAGKDVSTFEVSLTDMNTKIADAKAEAKIALDLTASLEADNGDKAVFDANHQALVSARSHIRTATAGLRAARQDMKTILNAVKDVHMESKLHASGTSQTSL